MGVMATVIERTLRRVCQGNDESSTTLAGALQCGGQPSQGRKGVREEELLASLQALLDVVHGQGRRGAADRIGLALVRALGGGRKIIAGHPK